MGDLKAFMQPPVTDVTKDVVISERFKDENGKVQPFTIRVINQEVNDNIKRQCSMPMKKNGVVVGSTLDTDKYTKMLLQACTVTPNFKAVELCDFYKTRDSLEVPGRMLTAGEYNKLMKEINRLNGFVENEDETLKEEAKN